MPVCLIRTGRPAAMIAQVSDVANDYAAAARAHYRQAKRGASAVVQARIDRQTRIYSGQPREAVERVIDACPQVGG